MINNSLQSTKIDTVDFPLIPIRNQRHYYYLSGLLFSSAAS